MQDLSEFLVPKRVALNQLVLDPNNPRFAQLGGDSIAVPESRFTEDKVQQSAQRKMLDPLFEVAELRDTMLAVGYLPMDRMVVKRLNQTNDIGLPYCVVVEGNRRLAALRLIKELHDEGKVTLDDAWLAKLDGIDVLELSASAPESALLVLPGLRHVSGIKEWGPYQKAKAVHKLRESGVSPTEAAQSLGLSTRAANMAYRCYLALEQMKLDEEFGEYAEPRMYSYFEETFKRPSVKTWLDWSDEEKRFQNDANLSEFYSWIVPQRDGDDLVPPKLPEAKSLRELGAIIENPDAMASFRTPTGSLVRAVAIQESEQQRISWEPQVIAAREVLRRLSPSDLRDITDQELNSINELLAVIRQVQADRESLLDATSPAE